METDYRILLLIIGCMVVLYSFITAQFLLGIVAAVLIIIAILILPAIEPWIKSH